MARRYEYHIYFLVVKTEAGTSHGTSLVPHYRTHGTCNGKRLRQMRSYSSDIGREMEDFERYR